MERPTSGEHRDEAEKLEKRRESRAEGRGRKTTAPIGLG
jgi:hypothetical protein